MLTAFFVGTIVLATVIEKTEAPVSALSPSLAVHHLHVSDEQPAASRSTPATIGLELWVDCDGGSDGAAGTSASTALRTIKRAQQMVRVRRSATASAVVVTISGVCELLAPLAFTDADSGASEALPVVYRGASGGKGIVSGGRIPTDWQLAPWPNTAAVWSADVNAFPIDVKTLRSQHGDGQWLQRSRWPKQVGGNYSSGWLALDATVSLNGPNTCGDACTKRGICKHWDQPPGTKPNNKLLPCWGGGFRNATNLGVDLTHCETSHPSKLCVSDIVPPPGYNMRSYEWGSPSDLWVNTFGGEEKDCLNQLRPVSAANFSSNGQKLALISSFWGAGVPTVSAASQYPKQEGSARFFLENVAAALAPGEFFLARNCSAALKHCGERRGRTLFYWPAAGAPPPSASSPVFPQLFELLRMNGTRHFVLSNLTFRDTSFAAEGGWNGVAGEPSDGAIRISNSSDIRIEASQFLAGISGYGIRIGNYSSNVQVIGNLFADLGQGGVLMGNSNMNGISDVHPAPLPGEEPHNCTVAWNVFENIGVILKHVSAIGMRTASSNLVSHNSIKGSPRYGISMTSWRNTDGSGWGQSTGNAIEHNVISDTCLETNDCGAVNMAGGGDAAHGKWAWNLNETVRWNRITRTLGAEARDGKHVCREAKGGWGGQPRHVFSPEAESDCAWATWAIYLDGGSPPAGGTSGVNIFQNELEATTSGAVFVNGGGNVTIENNVILNGKASQILIYSYNRNASEYGCPGTQILRNIFQFSETALDASRSGWSNGPVRAYGGHFMSPAQHLPGMCLISSTITNANNNTFWNKRLGQAGTEARALFGSVGVPPLNLSQWQEASIMVTGHMDTASIVADPQLVLDNATGHYTLQPTSPALPLGFKPIPPIRCPTRAPPHSSEMRLPAAAGR
jgi:hypothetical protein